MVRGRTVAYLLGGFLLLLASCTGGGGPEETTSPPGATITGPVRGGTMHLAATNDIINLDNAQAVNTQDYSLVAGALYEGLYHIDTSGELVPGLAAGLPEVSEDGLTYTIALAEGAMFAGPDFTPREVTAEDAAYGMIRALDPNLKPAPSWGGGYLYPILGAPEFAAGEADTVKGIEVLDDRALEITLGQPTTSFIYSLTVATSWPVPKEAAEERSEDFANAPVGAGPFYVQEWNKGESITIARNEGYVDPDLPYLDAITIDLQVDPNTQVLRLQNGEVDALFEPYTLPQASLLQLLDDPNISPHITPSVGPTIYYLAMNTQGIFADRDLRLAVAHALTRDFVAQFGDQARPWNQIYASTTRQSDPEGTTVPEHDPDLARDLLEQAAYDGTRVRIIYDVTDPFTSAMSTSLKQDLESIGMKVELNGLQPAQFFSPDGYQDPKNYDISPTYWRQDYPDGQDYISTNFVCAQVEPPYGLNVARYCNTEVDDLLARTDGLPFGPERDELLRQIQQMIIDDAGGIPVMEVTSPVIASPSVGEIVSIPTYAPFDWKLSWLTSPEEG